MADLKKIQVIGIVELAYHNEVLRSYILIMLQLCEKINVFTLHQNYLQLYDLQQHENIHWITFNNQFESGTFLKLHFKTLSACELIIVTSLPNNLKYFIPFKFPSKSCIVIHSFNKYFKPGFSKFLIGTGIDGIKDLVKIARYYLTGELNKYQKVLKTFDCLIFPSSFILEFNQNKYHLNQFSNPLEIDFTVHEKINLLDDTGVIKIVIPGTVSEKSRDYKMVSNAFKILISHLSKKIELVLLGQIIDRRTLKYIEELEQLQNEHFKIITFNSFIHQSIFDEHLLSAHFLILPLQKNMKHGIFKEKFGYTAASGNINDMVKYGIPSILPDFYPLDPVLEPLVVRYKDETSLIEQITYMLHTDLELIKEQAHFGLMKYNASSLAKKFLNQIYQP